MGSDEVIVLDTHAWVWWVSNPERLSKKSKDAIDRTAKNHAIYISSISAWEVAQLVAGGRLQLRMEPREWIAKSEALPFVTFVPVSNGIAVKSVQLPGTLHGDPADRMIIATALTLGAVLVTKDEKIRKYSHVKTLW